MVRSVYLMPHHILAEGVYDGSGSRLGRMGDTRVGVDSTWEKVVCFLFIVKFLPCEEYLSFSIINFDVMINDIE